MALEATNTNEAIISWGEVPAEKRITRIAFQGVAGAYGEIAARLAHPDANLIGFPTFNSVISAVTAGEVDVGILPVENSLAGTVFQSFDLLLQSDLHIVREIDLQIKHHLLALPGVKVEDIRRVRSHSQALAQCDAFLTKNRIDPITESNTAAAAQSLIERDARDEGVIASKRAAEIYGLEVLIEGLEDESFNYTRFFALSKDEPEYTDEPHKTSLVFALRNQAGALLEALSELQGLNLTRIESRPRRDRAWSYLIYTDFEGHIREPAASKSLIGLLRKAAFVKVLGSYPYNIEPLSESTMHIRSIPDIS